MATILLTGANGNVSGAAIRALQGSGHKLIGLVRDEAKAEPLKALGVELRVGDLSKPRSLEGAFNGVDTAFLLTTVGLTAPALASNALWAARQGGGEARRPVVGGGRGPRRPDVQQPPARAVGQVSSCTRA